MSSRKFSFSDLAKWKRIHGETINCPGSPFSESSMLFPADWSEFNNMFFSRRNVIVEYPKEFNISTICLMGFYSALKVAKRGINIGLCGFGGINGFPEIGTLTKKLSNKNWDENVLFIYSTTPFVEFRNRVLESDEWMMNAGDVKSQETIIKDIHNTKGFSELNVNKELWTANRALMGWRHTYEKDHWRRKFVVSWADSGRTQIDEVMEKYPDQFLFIPYTKEKRLVDGWYAKNATMVDPGFDIQLMNPEIDPRKVFLYAATNHLYDFRMFARLLPDAVEKYMSKEELKELGV